MKKRFKMLNRANKIYILRWTVDGKLFGPDWEEIATFDNQASNVERCKTIIRLLNECDKHTNHPDYDSRRNK